ncbi:MAG: isopentenyl-diphosphate Delta-isomerase [Actinomycetota bacterium]|nr:isopentenyl-diphosphate Delta-isomerase [Actinomycetota bacterium]
MHPDDAPVVLLDEDRRPIGQLPKSQVHHATTPLHLAFSCYIVDDAGRLLMTRRATSKQTWPGVWTNTCCGHPLPDEPSAQAAARRLREELGVQLVRSEMALPEFRYRAVASDGVVENEICPVLVGSIEGQLQPDPAEVLEHRWARWPDVVALATVAPWAISPWAALQIPLLAALDHPLLGERARWGRVRGGR